MKKENILTIITAIIAVLFFYAAFSKLIDYDKSIDQMHNQIFPSFISSILTWLIPTLEIILMLGLLFPTTRIKALLASLILLIIFTLYIAVAMTGAFGRIPCSCGGILENMSYGTHLIFNLIFIALAIVGLIIENNKWYNFFKRKEHINQYK
ncbi:MauE/DoxX family redox-associated membrane protein [Pedobacter caeni]|uniref:Methylamine utilisation protein MauE n=1 Tax=Pedobacter caeni TaxID=288992 RepID=A0A1M5GT08_9SPHI|nr:MauE/DoxX family redox-associated membrane protein [Pedobacter caeni]SHG06904.1 Methylamine utilisation protein MauE [Pedobacter caeni]